MTKKGFIQISLLIAIIAGVLVLSGAGYFGVKQYRNYQTKKTEDAWVAQETQQQKDSEVEKLKQEVESLKKQQSQQVNLDKQSQSGTKIIDSKDIQPYLPYVGQVQCSSPGEYITGSGFLMNIDGTAKAITNYHVVEGATECRISMDEPTYGFYGLDVNSIHRWNSYSDVAVLDMSTIVGKIDMGTLSKSGKGEPLPSHIHSPISSLKFCPLHIPLGTGIVAIGFPITTQYSQPVEPGSNITNDISPRTITFGTISAYVNPFSPLTDLPDDDYFTTAAIDSGNSGGLALSKINNNICLLGIPTWVSKGNFQNQGVIQNINNITYKSSL